MIRMDYVTTIGNIACGANILELFSLLLLSLVSSEENFKIHKLAFGLFLASSGLYFIATYYLYRYVGLYVCKMRTFNKIYTVLVEEHLNLIMT